MKCFVWKRNREGKCLDLSDEDMIVLANDYDGTVFFLDKEIAINFAGRNCGDLYEVELDMPDEKYMSFFGTVEFEYGKPTLVHYKEDFESEEGILAYEGDKILELGVVVSPYSD